MKQLSRLPVLLALLLTLTACSSPAPPPSQEEAAASKAPTLEELCGAGCQSYIADTITMQMGNRMDKTPDVRYFPIEDGAPLTDYAAIDETTAFEVDEEGSIVIRFAAGAVASEDNGEQSFRIPLL